GSSATMPASDVTLTDRLTALGVSAVTNRVTSTVTRERGRTISLCSVMVTGVPPSSTAWKLNVAVAGAEPGFWRVRYSAKPGRTVPSAKSKVVPAAGAPMTTVPPSTVAPTPGSAEK